MERKGPGSEAGRQERKHWASQMSGPNREERLWVVERAKEHVDPAKLPEVEKWIMGTRRSRSDLIALCKRWGISESTLAGPWKP